MRVAFASRGRALREEGLPKEALLSRLAGEPVGTSKEPSASEKSLAQNEAATHLGACRGLFCGSPTVPPGWYGWGLISPSAALSAPGHRGAPPIFSPKEVIPRSFLNHRQATSLTAEGGGGSQGAPPPHLGTEEMPPLAQLLAEPPLLCPATLVLLGGSISRSRGCAEKKTIGRERRCQAGGGEEGPAL